ncbi:CVNH domain-containing protein [Sorangium sp. So ce1000]|uniref:CVNH domain-containing protein n=1 Tax=Sorangium sp. So ce1000 TaxID=3133325 RepID=UPI003F645E8E
MKTLFGALILGALSLSAVLSSSDVAQAQARARPPRGSYSRTCRDIRTVRGTLFARCEDRSGNWHPTRLDAFKRCRGDIANDNGRLRCARGR